MNVEVNVRDRVLRPVAEVFAAIVDPARMSHYFITRGSGPMKAGATLDWEFTDVGRRLSVDVMGVVQRGAAAAGHQGALRLCAWTAPAYAARLPR